jgi:Tfp pilus assembly protein PilZ
MNTAHRAPEQEHPVMHHASVPSRHAASTEISRDRAPRSRRAPALLPNRRRHARVHARGVAGHLQTMEARTMGCAVENLSMGGIFVRSAVILDPGTPVKLQLVRPGLKKAIQAVGRVVSIVTPAEARERGIVAGMGIGIEFVDHDTEQRLRALVEDLGGSPAMAAPAAPMAPAAPAIPAAPRMAAAPAPAAAPVAQAAPRMAMPAAPVAPAAPARIEVEAVIEAQDRRVAQLEAEIKALRHELLRRNRTIGDLANRLSAYEPVG